MTTSKKIFNQDGFNEELSKLHILQSGYQKVFNALTALNFVETPTIQELHTLILSGDPSGYIKDIAVKRTHAPQIAGVALSREKLAELVELPDLTELTKAVSTAKPSVGRRGYEKFHIDKEGNVNINDAVLKELEEKHTFVPQGKNEERFFAAHERAIEALEDLRQAYNATGMEPERSPGEFLAAFKRNFVRSSLKRGLHRPFFLYKAIERKRE